MSGSVRPYEIVAPLELFQVLRALKRAERRPLEDYLSRLTRLPGLAGDLEQIGDDGRPHQIKLIGDWLISYRADHAVREIRFTGLERIE